MKLVILIIGFAVISMSFLFFNLTKIERVLSRCKNNNNILKK